MANFGYEIDASFTEGLNDLIFGTKAPCPEVGSGVSITVRLVSWDVGDKVKCCLYDASGDKVTNGETEERTTGGGVGWYTFAFPVAPTLAVADYWIVVFANDPPICCYYAYETAPGYTMKYQGSRVYELGFPASIAGLGLDYEDSATSIYCTYETAPPAKKSLVQAALISIGSLIVIPTLREVLKFAPVRI